MDSILQFVLFYGVMAIAVLLIGYGLYGYAKQVFDANRR